MEQLMKALEQHIKEQTSWIDLEQPQKDKANTDTIKKKTPSRSKEEKVSDKK